MVQAKIQNRVQTSSAKKSRSHALRTSFTQYLFKSCAFLLILAVVVTSLSMEAEARRRKKSRHKQKRARAEVINEPKLYERMGGAKGLSDIVDEWMRLNLADQRVAPYFVQLTSHPDRLAKMRKGLNDQLCELADGPCQYIGPDMSKAHEGMKIGEEQFLAFADNLFQSMQKFNIPEREKNEMLGRLDEYRPEVVPEGAAHAGQATGHSSFN